MILMTYAVVLIESWILHERSFLIELLKRNDGHMGRAAREAGVDRKTIERMVKKHGLRELF